MAPTSPILTHDDFHFSSMLDDIEDMTRYVPGGYHPIVIGDILSKESESGACRYRIIHKLGFGSYGTVWLAQKTGSSEEFVAVKITTAEDGPTRELAMLEVIAKMQANDGQLPNILKVFDLFTLHGPNGTHSVLVTEVVVPILPLLSRKWPHTPFWFKVAAYGLTQAIAQLHAAKIVHADLHLGNVGVAIPPITHQQQDDVIQFLSPHSLTIVLPVSAAKQTPSLPAYLVESCKLPNYYNKIACSDLPQIKLFDFGNAHEAGTLPLKFQNALEACAPELVFARVIENTANPPVEAPADVWALGAAIYEIMTGSSLFYGVGMKGLANRMVTMAGSLPPEWQNWYDNLSTVPEVSPSSAAGWWASRRKALSRRCVDDADTDALITLLQKVLVLDPSKRPTAAEILQSPWFSHIAAVLE